MNAPMLVNASLVLPDTKPFLKDPFLGVFVKKIGKKYKL
jgi:hypothetical protein